MNPSLLNHDGTPKVLYHQTDGEFTVFDVGRYGAGTRDNEAPFGVFLIALKRNRIAGRSIRCYRNVCGISKMSREKSLAELCVTASAAEFYGRCRFTGENEFIVYFLFIKFYNYHRYF